MRVEIRKLASIIEKKIIEIADDVEAYIRCEPVIVHTHQTDKLPRIHPKAFESVRCEVCKEALHASNNETMQTWIETNIGNFCLKHFDLRRLYGRECNNHTISECVLEMEASR
jgi:hypothetical protein